MGLSFFNWLENGNSLESNSELKIQLFIIDTVPNTTVSRSAPLELFPMPGLDFPTEPTKGFKLLARLVRTRISKYGLPTLKQKKAKIMDKYTLNRLLGKSHAEVFRVSFMIPEI